MNRNEAKQILLLYRPGTADGDDPQVAEALAWAQRDAELARWLEQVCAQQIALRAKFRQLEPPAGLMEQIISEQAASRRRPLGRPKVLLGLAAMLVAVLVAVLAAGGFWLHPQPQRANDNTLVIFQNRMASAALRGYAMDLTTGDASGIRDYLGHHAAPADYVLPPALQKAGLAGCAIQGWQGTKVAMICFRTGQPLATGAQSDLWLFVVDRASVAGAPAGSRPQFARVNRLNTAIWTQGDKLYLLGATGDEALLRSFL